MKHHLKKILFAKTVLGLELGNGYMAAVQLLQSPRGTDIRKVAMRELQDPAQMVAELKNFFETEGLRSDVLITALPSSLASIRTLDLPIRTPGRLRQIITYQMEPLLPHAVDDVVADCLVPVKGEMITAVGIEKGTLSDHLKALSDADLDPHRVSIQEVALFFLYLDISRGKSEGTAAIVRLGGKETAIQIIRHGRLDFIRVFPGSKDRGHCSMRRSGSTV